MTLFSAKFFEILKTFSAAELKSFESWLQSPWCNTNKNLLTLLQKTKKYYPDFVNDRITKERLFKQVLPTGKYSNRRMNNLLSEGYKAAEKFVIFQKLSSDTNLQNNLKIQEFQERHLDDWFFRDTEKEITRLEEKEIKNHDDYLYSSLLHRRRYHYSDSGNRAKYGSTDLLKTEESSETVYLAEKAFIINEKIFRTRITREKYSEIKQEIDKWSVAAEEFDIPAFTFYRLRFRHYRTGQTEDFLILKRYFTENYASFNLTDKKIFLISLINENIQLLKAQELPTTSPLPLYKIGMENNLLLYKNILSKFTYVSLVTLSNTARDFAYTRKVINDYADNLHHHLREDTVRWAEAHTAYYQNELHRALDLLLHYTPSDTFIRNRSKFLTVQIYFDIYLKDASYSDFLVSYLENTEKWYRREDYKSKDYKQSNLRFIQICRKLVKAWQNPDLAIEKIENLLKTEKNLQGAEWLQRKIDFIISVKTEGSSAKRMTSSDIQPRD